MSVQTNEYKDLLTFIANNTSLTNNVISLALTQINETFTPTNNKTTNSLMRLAINMYATIHDNDTMSSIVTPTVEKIKEADFNNINSTIKPNENRTAEIVTVAMKPRISTEMPIWLIPCYSVILLIGIIGNLLVISTLVQNRRMRTITNLFLFNLAISDLLLGVLCMPVTLVGTLLRHFIFGQFFCKLIQFSQATSVAVSSWTLVAISCERYYAICHPLRSRTWQTLNHAYRIIGFIWFGSVLCMLPIAIFSQLMPTSRQGLRKCREQWPADSLVYERSYNIFLDLVLLVLPLLILSFAYILITRTLYVGMQNERAMIFGSVPTAPAGGSIGSKFSNELETLTTALVPTTQSIKITATKQKSRFQFNVSFRIRGCNADVAGGGGGDNIDDFTVQPTRKRSKKASKSQSHHLQQQQQNLQNQQVILSSVQQHNLQGFDDSGATQNLASKTAAQKRKLLTATDGRRHLYCASSAGSIKSLNHNNNDRCGGLNGTGSSSSTSPSPSMTVINVPQQQRFRLYQQRHQSQQQQQQLEIYMQQPDMERCKSTSTPSLRLHDTALRRSNKTKSLESKKRVIKMLFVLVLEFFICWTPLYIINTVAMFIGPAIYEYVPYTSISFFQLLAYSSSCCNPITYCFMNAGFRRAFLDTFKGLQFRRGLFRHRSTSNQSIAGNSIIMANSGTMLTTNTMLDSPRL
ncbi:cholecystokinin receptor type A-like [Eurosta solidaginis]|uniref:cholecystokinin receptor type A-like n=1 Tax=Eurosta solidaginis TaxID=178769 RepID=UPI003530E512